MPTRPCGPFSPPIRSPDLGIRPLGRGRSVAGPGLVATDLRPGGEWPRSWQEPGPARVRVCGVELSTGQLILGAVLGIVWAVLGYRLSENDRRVLGRTPWGLPSALWAFFWFLFLPLGLILYLIAHSTGVRQAQQHPPLPGALDSRTAAAGHAGQRLRHVPCVSPAGELTTGAAGAATNPGRPARRPAVAGRPADGRCRDRCPGWRPVQWAALAAGLASRPEREIPLPLVGRAAVDITGLDRWTPSHRHQPRSTHRPLLTAWDAGSLLGPARMAKVTPCPRLIHRVVGAATVDFEWAPGWWVRERTDGSAGSEERSQRDPRRGFRRLPGGTDSGPTLTG